MSDIKKPRKRAHTLLKEGATTPQSTQRSDAASQSAGGTLYIDPVTTVQAGPSLRRFPLELRLEIDRYLQMPGADTKTFAAVKKKFDLNLTTNGQSARFVEMGTTNVMDAACYLCGPVMRRGLLIVVKPASGSTFNGGDAAIITFYGKGNNEDGRNVISRWSIWTPDGIKDNVLVDRMIIDSASDHESGEQGVIPPAKKRKYTRRSQKQQEDLGEEDLGQVTTSQTETAVKRESAGSDVDHQSIFLPAHQTAEQDDSVVTQRPSPPQSRSFSLLTDYLAQDSLVQDNLVRDTARRGTLHAGTEGDRVFLVFSATPDGDTSLSKTLTQCSSVQKLFAYAFKAGISSAEVVILSVIVGDVTVDIVRDDNEDFAELLQAVRDRQAMLGDDDLIKVVVAPIQF